MVMGVMLISDTSWALRACGKGRVMQNSDCSNTNRNWNFSCCPSGSRAIGVAYNDLKNQDYADAIGVVCRDINYGNEVVQTDFSSNPTRFECDKTEILSGIAFADAKKKNGSGEDEMDAITALCENPKYPSKRLRKVYNNDLYNAQRENEQSVSLAEGRRVVGIAYREIDKGSSDRADCVALIVCEEKDYLAGKCD